MNMQINMWHHLPPQVSQNFVGNTALVLKLKAAGMSNSIYGQYHIEIQDIIKQFYYTYIDSFSMEYLKRQSLAALLQSSYMTAGDLENSAWIVSHTDKKKKVSQFSFLG